MRERKSQHSLFSTAIWPEWWYRSQWQSLVRQIVEESDRLASATDDDLKQRARNCRHNIKFSVNESAILIDVFALVREIAGRVHGMRHHPVQILGAVTMSHGWIAEMATGEGKTLASLMTIVFLALKGKGCHVFTANDYLAERDRNFSQPLLDWFGLTSAVLKPQESDQIRKACYRAGVTYGSEREFGFDFLRDRLNRLADAEDGAGFDDHRPGEYVQNGHAYAVIDEADSILIDQATTPLIISCPQPPTNEELELFQWSEHVSGQLEVSVDYSMDTRLRSARLTRSGCRKLRLRQKPLPIGQLPAESVYTQVERAIAARHFYRENREYVIIDERVEIIDQGTGRILPGRKWRDGLQQAIEIRAGLSPSDSTGSAARVTLQTYLRNYPFLCGMTGTASEARRELSRTYGLHLMTIARHHPSRLRRMPPRVFVTGTQKWTALTAELETIVSAGRAVLVGTTSISSSERCASMLRARGLDVQVLHAKYDRDEAEIVAKAGLPGRVTVATNMAGRGTDIKLHPDVRDAGGLHVIVSEMNRSPRIDRQLAGRAGRQGDPGSFQIFASLEDDLLTILGARAVARLKSKAPKTSSGELNESWISLFQRAQQMYEKRHERERNQLLIRERTMREKLTPLGLDPAIESIPD